MTMKSPYLSSLILWIFVSTHYTAAWTFTPSTTIARIVRTLPTGSSLRKSSTAAFQAPSRIQSLGFSSLHSIIERGFIRKALLSSVTSTADVIENNNNSNVSGSNDGDKSIDEEWEYVEYEMLKESDFLASEWLVGTNWDSSPNKIDETWCRLATDRDGKNVAIWGDKSEGKWAFDVASQFLSVSKEYVWGKQIWAGVIDDYYFCRGTVRGWTYVTAASVLGQWQAKRLGVDPEEAGTPPWFNSAEEDN